MTDLHTSNGIIAPAVYTGKKYGGETEEQQPGFNDQLPLIKESDGARKKLLISTAVIAATLIGGITAGVIVGFLT